jgi:hypothetical protein
VLETHLLSNREAVFSTWSVPRTYKKDEDCSSQLSFEMPACQDMSLGAEELELGQVLERAVEGD